MPPVISMASTLPWSTGGDCADHFYDTCIDHGVIHQRRKGIAICNATFYFLKILGAEKE